MLKIIPLGGLAEIGKNMTAVVYGDAVLVVDAGLAFPDEEMLGIDIVIPDFTFLLQRRDQVRGVVLTHGHEDHVGALPYLLRELDVPVFATRLTLGLVRRKLEEEQVRLHPGSRELQPGQWLDLPPFRILPFRVTHSIPDSVGLGIETPGGIVVITGDYKFDQTPVDGRPTDYHLLAELGRRGVLVLLGDSTNAERPGVTPSEREVGATLNQVFQQAPGRILVTTFATNVHRLQQVIETAERFGRRVAVIGRSMENTVAVARELGYLQADPGTLVSLEELKGLPPEKVTILTTGSQGEPTSALTLMAAGEYRRVEILPGDTVVLAATPVPGNEKLVHRTIDNLFRQGATVVYGREAGVHVSGHGSQEELKLMLNLVRPRYLIPVHGEYRHLIHHARLAREVGIPADRVLIGENGTVFAFDGERARVEGRVPAGRVFVDGLGVGDVGAAVLRDRRQLAEDGVLVVVMTVNRESGELLAEPEIVSRGFVYVKESEELLEQARQRASEVLQRHLKRNNGSGRNAVRNRVRDALAQFLFERTRRRPMIVPIVVEV